MNSLSHHEQWSSMTGEEQQVTTAENKLVNVVGITQLVQYKGLRLSWALSHGKYYHFDEIDDDVFLTEQLSVEHEQIVLV